MPEPTRWAINRCTHCGKLTERTDGHCAETVDRDYPLEEITVARVPVTDAVVETATRSFTDIHRHNAPLKYGAHARETMRAALAAAFKEEHPDPRSEQ